VICQDASDSHVGSGWPTGIRRPCEAGVIEVVSVPRGRGETDPLALWGVSVGRIGSIIGRIGVSLVLEGTFTPVMVALPVAIAIDTP
jgi:hypothetical protein